MMIAFFPPISVMTRLMWSCPGGVCDACRWISSPTARDPVKAMMWTSGWFTSAGPTSSPIPGRKLTTPGGKPASSNTSISLAAITGDCSAGFITTVLPATSAAVVMPQRMAIGKFHGAMVTVTPRGS
jgi:hypothetical protein